MLREDLWKIVEAEIDRQAQDAFDICDWEAANPEIGGQEHGAVQHHKEFLTKRGFTFETPVYGLETAYKSVLPGAGAGRKVALMVEYDALEGLGHGCGHNVHGPMSLLAAAGLATIMDKIPGELQVLGTPAEETYGGKIFMAERGAFDGLDFSMMIHTSAGASCVPHRSMACRGYRFTFEGIASHASGAPWKGRNALNGVRILFDALDMWRQHLPPEIRIHGVVEEGGYYPNIVPAKAVAKIEFRAPDQKMEEDLVAKALDCARGAALCTGTKVSWDFFEGSFDCMNPNPAAENMVQKIFDEMGIPTVPPRPAGGSTDVGNASWHCPALQPSLDISNGVEVPGHTREYVAISTTPAVHPRIVIGAKILAKSMFIVLTDDAVASAIRADFKTR